MSTDRPAPCPTGYPRAIRTPGTLSATAAPARRTARKYMHTGCATRGAGASTVTAASCGWPTWARAVSRKWIASSPAATTVGAASRVPDHTTPTAARMRRAAGRRSPSTITRSASRLPAGTSTVVRRSRRLPERYVLGDFVSGRIWHIAGDTAPTLTVTTGFDSGLSIASFAEGGDGELYVVHYGGTLHRLRQVASSGGTVATQLSATGCVDSNDPTRPAAGLVPYAPNAPFWSDSASKDRYLALPNGTSLTVTATGDIDFPNGTVLVKQFRLGGRPVETRLFMRHTDGEWAGYTYEWNAQGTDATRVAGGKAAAVGSQSWVFPSEAQCLACHTAAAGRSLGLEIAQLNGALLYPQTGRTANQLATLDAIGMFSPALGTPPAALPVIPDPFGTAHPT